MGVMQGLLNVCAGFLLAVLWFDLMFDVQVLAYVSVAELPESVLSSIAAYYGRVTSASMNFLVALVMLVAVALSFWRIYKGNNTNWKLALSALLICIPIVAAQVLIFPAAKTLASRVDSLTLQSELAVQICYAHIFCFICIVGFLFLQWLISTEQNIAEPELV